MYPKQILLEKVSADPALLSWAETRPKRKIDDRALACFWWEYSRSSPSVISAVKKTFNPKYALTDENAPSGQILGAHVYEFLGPTLRCFIGRRSFNRISWNEAEKLKSPRKDDERSVADIWYDFVKYMMRPPIACDKLPIEVRSEELSGLRRRVDFSKRFTCYYNRIPRASESLYRGNACTSFLVTVDWSFSFPKITQAFRNELDRMLPKYIENEKKAIASTFSVSVLRIRPRSALGWLFILRAFEECSDWVEFEKKYTQTFIDITGAMPSRQDLKRNRKRALRIIEWLETVVVPKAI